MEVVTFDGLTLAAAPGLVMTPRPASEALVAAAARYLGARGCRVADVGTGSGALAIAIASRCRNAEVWATDISEEACRLAAANVRRHGLGDRVFVRRGDLLAPLEGGFDVIVANLPYLARAAAHAYPELAAEPFAAAFAPGDGLGPSRRLVAAARGRLSGGGMLLLQLHRQVVAARRSELHRLARALRAPTPAASAVAEAVSGAAA